MIGFKKRSKINKIKNKEYTQKIFNRIIILIVCILCIWGYFYRRNKMNNYSITICRIKSFGFSKGIGARPPVAIYTYTVDGIIYTQDSPYPDKDSVKVGNYYKLKYSIDNPNVSDVLFDEGCVSDR